jgi:hypothetical protein
MATQKAILKREIVAYGAPALNSLTLTALDDEREVYIIADVMTEQNDPDPLIVVAARIVAGKIVIEADRTDKPLVEALTAAGVPREHIVLAYAGETRPDAEQLAANWPPHQADGQ